MKNQALPLMPYKHKFESIFKLRFADYADPIFGFDVVKLDKDIKVPGGISTSDFIKRKYGEEARDMVSAMIRCLQ